MCHLLDRYLAEQDEIAAYYDRLAEQEQETHDREPEPVFEEEGF